MLSYVALQDGPGAGSGSVESRRTTQEMPVPDASTFLTALQAQNGNVKATAEILGISRGRAYRMMDKLDSLDLAALRRREVPEPPT